MKKYIDLTNQLSLLRKEAINGIISFIETKSNGFINLTKEGIYVAFDEVLSIQTLNADGEFTCYDTSYDLDILATDTLLEIYKHLESHFEIN